MSKKNVLVLLVLAVIAAAAIYVRFRVLPQLTVEVPEYQAPGKLVLAEQNWSVAQRTEYHHQSQGTRLIPYAWLMALEQPCLALTECEPFAKQEYLGRFGFLESPKDPELNPGGLPVGFALDRSFHDPVGPNSVPTVGLTCAACHTGQFRYGGYAVQVDGAPAMIEVTQFQKALGVALALTRKIPIYKSLRYPRFEKKVLGPDATQAQKDELARNFDAYMAPLVAETEFTNANHIYDNQAGFVRTDALTRIGNQVFAVDTKLNSNFVPANAPVRFPQIWDASWYSWIQYNASISDPMVRNIGEALGVRAAARLYNPDAAKFDNSVNVEGGWKLEEQLAGEAPFLTGDAPHKGLASPKWPAQFPPLDAAKVGKGKELYKKYCESCHLPSITDLLADRKAAQPARWWKNGQGRMFLVAPEVPVEKIGTDPHEAMDFIARTAATGDLKLGTLSAANGLKAVTEAIRGNYYASRGFSPEIRIAWNGYRDPKDPSVRAPAVYKARTLNGIWAVSPYLHNGSVPTLYDLLSPAAERPKTFPVGTMEFDPVKVGHVTKELKGAYLFDTGDDHPGNSNRGHEFRNAPGEKGVIGPALSADERWALIEYLKSL